MTIQHKHFREDRLERATNELQATLRKQLPAEVGFVLTCFDASGDGFLTCTRHDFAPALAYATTASRAETIAMLRELLRILGDRS